MQWDALEVALRWGFTPKSELVWVKTKSVSGVEIPAEGDEPEPGRMGLGHYTRNDHEVCLICAKGRGASLVQAHNIRSVVYAPRTPRHSEKPEATYAAIEAMLGDLGPRVELFARRHRPGWECMGNELGVEIGFGLLGGTHG
jgi:N6-adenosine-specific RNA methylase IME4